MREGKRLSAFELYPKIKKFKENILILDESISTGSTLDSLYEMLFHEGVKLMRTAVVLGHSGADYYYREPDIIGFTIDNIEFYRKLCDALGYGNRKASFQAIKEFRVSRQENFKKKSMKCKNEI